MTSMICLDFDANSSAIIVPRSSRAILLRDNNNINNSLPFYP